MQNMNFVRLAKGLQGQVSELLPVDTNIYKKIGDKKHQDWYKSIFLYQDEHKKQFDEKKSVAGMSGLLTDKLVFDLDDASDLEHARKDTLAVCTRLMDNGVNADHINLFFSGAKGFGVVLNLNETITRQEFVNVVFNVAGDLKTFDTTINDYSRILRMPLTRHPKSGLYKIPLSLAELSDLSIDEIKELAKDVSGYDEDSLSEDLCRISLTPKLIALKNKEYKKVNTSPVVSKELDFDPSSIDFNECPRWLEPARFALQQGYFRGSQTATQGERNKAFLILAATYRNQGFSSEHALGLLMATANIQAERTGEDPYSEDQMVREVINTVYNPSWRGGQFGKDEPLLVSIRERFGINEEEELSKPFVQIKDVGDRFKNFAANFQQNRILTGIEALDKKLVLTTGMAVGLLGAPSSGKTSILNAIVEYQSQKDISCIYQSLDMSDNLLYLRLLQKYSRLPIEQILEAFEGNKLDKNLQDAYASVLKNYSNVHFNFRSAMTVEQIDKDVANYIKETGRNPKFIAIDYLEKVRSDFSDPTTSSGLVVSQLSDLAKKYDACVMVLLQPQKSAGDPSQELLSMRNVKGASVIEQDLRCILTTWRPGFNPKDSSQDKFLSMAIVKNNMGELGQFDFKWNGITGSINSLEYSDKKQLQELRDEIMAKETMKKTDWDL